jgi:hypothetical protein
MLVPIGRVNRGIQTQPGEVWASTGAASAAAATVSRAVHSAQAAAAAAGAAVAYASVSTAVTATTSSSSALMVAAGGELSAEAEPGGVSWLAGGLASSRASVQRKVPAFAQHNSNSSSPRHASSKSPAAGSPSASTAGCKSGGADLTQDNAEARVLSDVLVLLAGGDVQLLQQGELLRVISSLYSSKASADARALRSHSSPLSMWAFVLRQLFGGPGSDGGSSGSNADGVTALAQLLGSAQALDGSSKEVAAFHAALVDSIPYSVAAAAGLAGGSSGGNGAGSARVCSAGSEGGEQHSGSLTPRGTGRGIVTLRGAWGEVSCLRVPQVGNAT